MKQLLAGLLGLSVMVSLFLKVPEVSQGMAEGVSLCMQVLLPSLLPFMIVISFLSFSGGLLLLAKLLSPLFALLRFPHVLREVWLASFLGGYPTGAHTLAALVQQGAMSGEAAGRMLRCCVNPGPAFLVLAVGQSMLGSRHIRGLLLLSQAIFSLLLCTLLCRSTCHISSKAAVKQRYSLSDAFVTAVSSASSSMLTVFAFVLTFSIFISLIEAYAPGLKIASAFSEVTLGCACAVEIGGKMGLLLIAFFIGFGGISVGFQVIALARKANIPINGFWRSRIFAGVLNTCIFRLLLIFDKTAVSVLSSQNLPAAVWSCDRLLGAVCIVAMLLISQKRLEDAV